MKIYVAAVEALKKKEKEDSVTTRVLDQSQGSGAVFS
jgi:hypothetical protein